MKVCPRCSYVDTDGRRVCFACRGSLMATPARELVEILEMREAALVGAGEPAGRAPWGPGLTVVVEDAWNEVGPENAEPSPGAVAVAPPEDPPAPVRSHGRATGGRFPSAAIDGSPIVPALDPRPSAFESAFDVAPSAGRDAMIVGTTADAGAERGRDDAPDISPERFSDDVFDVRADVVLGSASGVGATVFEPARGVGTEGPLVADPPQQPRDELAELTRRRLVKLYDARTAAVPREMDTPVTAARPVGPPRGATVRRAARRSRRRTVLALIVAVLAVAGGRTLAGAVKFGGGPPAIDVTTPVDKLPWRTVQAGPVRIVAPGAPVSGASAGYQRYALPDLDLMVTVRAPAPALASDAALRTYTSQLAAQLGGRLIEGFALVSGEGTGFSARLEVDGRTTLLYVLSAPGAVVEVRGDLHAGDPARPQAIFERTINSIEVR